MLRFEDSIYLWLLLTIPFLVLVKFFYWYRQKKRLQKFGDPSLLKLLMPDVSLYRPNIKFTLMLTALAFLIIMLARPQMERRYQMKRGMG